MLKVAIGLVGYYQFVRGYPIGPELKERLETLASSDGRITIKEMNWGPIAIVQDFQSSATTYDRIVLVTAVDRGLDAGAVTCRHWMGGELAPLAVQDRVFEAVTGIISLDNLLVIGEHFGIWPAEVITVEAQLADSTFGDLVMSELEINRDSGEVRIVGTNPLAPAMEQVVDRVYERTWQAAIHGLDMTLPPIPLTVDQLNPLADVCHNQPIGRCGTSEPGD